MQFPLWCAVALLALSQPSAQSDITCSKPPSIEFALFSTRVSKEYPVGANVTYVCDFGYVNDGNERTSKCILSPDEETATWTTPHMSCKPRSCGDPGYVPDGHRVGSVFTFPNFVIYECEDGFRLRGSPRRYCQASGSWSGRLPSCEVIFCDAPADPENGRVSYSSLEYGSELKYECNEGYQLANKETVFCTPDGTWSSTDVKCIEITCDLPSAPKYGSVTVPGSEGNPLAGTVAFYSCEEGRIPDGPTTSRCLEIGEWTFPPPECREPCSVPYVPNGKIGRWIKQKYKTSLVFQTIPVGDALEDGEKLFLHCAKGYDPLGGENWQAALACNRGKWSTDPYCEIASCRSNPPSANNGIAVEVNNKHGGSVYYDCLADFIKVRPGNVTCFRGEWKGVPPICKDNRCSVEQLESRGLESGSKQFYRHGESLHITCKQGYIPSKRNSGQIRCENGEWKGQLSPCVPAGCTDSPPSILHGKAEIYFMDHGSEVKYVCERPYILEEDTKVLCLFGQWSGQPPKCEDSRCYLKDLKYKSGVSDEAESSTKSGEYLKVLCEEGYTPNGRAPKCFSGMWTEDSLSPCKESDCTVPWISQGAIRQRKVGENTWNWSKFRYERPVTMEKVHLGTTPSRRAELFLTCNKGYTIQGIRGLEEDRIYCSYGKWWPDAVCLREGTRYVRTTAAPKLTTEKTMVTKPTQATPVTMSSTTTRFVTSRTVPSSTASTTKVFTEATSLDIRSTEKFPIHEANEDCSCEYTSDDETIVAYLDDKELQLNDKVKNGSVVKFRCKQIGLQRLEGKLSIACDNCLQWSLNDYPKCIDPKSGDTVIVYDKVNISADGTLEVNKGQSFRLTCLAAETAEYPEWIIPDQTGVSITNELMERNGYIYYLSNLDLEDLTPEKDGSYECFVDPSQPTTVQIRVIDPNMRCPQFSDEEKEDVFVTYNKGTRVGSKATFSCREHGKKLDGKNALTCLSNGNWSDPPPQCVDILCNEHKQTDILLVSYTDSRKIGSFAIFHCFAPGERIGVSRTKCLENGQWADPTPFCRTPPCSVDSLFSVVPEGVVPYMDDVKNDTVPYNSTLKLHCEDDDMTLEGKSLAKCGKEGKWDVDKIRCVPGCLPLKIPPDSNLIVMPEKVLYKFGDIVTFSCPPGMDLSMELQLIMCLRGGWSDTQRPECIEAKEEDEETE